MTRIEHLKEKVANMSVEEFADLLGYCDGNDAFSILDTGFCTKQCPYKDVDLCAGKCKQGVIDWLNQEVITEKEVREDFLEVVYRELSDDVDNCRANRIIDAADECMEETARLLREEWEKEKC